MRRNVEIKFLAATHVAAAGPNVAIVDEKSPAATRTFHIAYSGNIGRHRIGIVLKMFLCTLSPPLAITRRAPSKYVNSGAIGLAISRVSFSRAFAFRTDFSDQRIVVVLVRESGFRPRWKHA